MLARLNGIDLAYSLEGTGEPVVLIGATGMPAAGWRFLQGPALIAAGYQTVTFASRGVAPSQAPPAPYRVADMAADTVALIEYLEVGPCHVVGVSLGGFVAEEVARSRPDLVSDCVLIASAGRATAYVRAKLQAARELFAAGPVPESYDVVDTLSLVLPFAALQNDDASVENWTGMLARQSAAWAGDDGRLGQFHAEWSWMLDEDRRAGWARVTPPCLVIGFENDLYFPPRVGREAAMTMPQGSFAEIRGATHAGHLEKSDEVNREVIGFLARR